METPEGNLVEGMRWLQGAFGIRFNASRGERGYVFRSRYKSLVIEEGRPLLCEGSVRAYVHSAERTVTLQAEAWSCTGARTDRTDP